MHRDAVAAVIFCDEPVADGAPAPEFLERFSSARELAAKFGIHLVDWFACDDDLFRSARCSVPNADEQPDWWDVPPLARRVRRSSNPRGTLRKLW